jgi:hypothetical protein
MNSFLLLLLSGCLTISSVSSQLRTAAALDLHEAPQTDPLGIIGLVQIGMLDGLDDDPQIKNRAISDEEPECSCAKPGRPIINYMKEQLQSAISDNGKLMNLALSGLKIFLKKNLATYNTVTGGILFAALDRAIPTGGTVIEQLFEQFISAGKGEAGEASAALLDKIKKAIETGSLDSLLKKQ